MITGAVIDMFRYIEPLWLGTNNKVSVKRVLALWFSYNLIRNISFAMSKLETIKSYADVAMLLGIEAALIGALLALTSYSNNLFTKLNNTTDTTNIQE